MKYKFRAECLHDILKLMEFRLVKSIPMKIKIEQHKILPDCVAEIKTDLSLIELKTIMHKIPDSHVMIETIAVASEYTGERV